MRCFLVLGMVVRFALLLTYFLYKYHVSHENKKEIQLSAVKTLKGSVSIWSKPFFLQNLCAGTHLIIPVLPSLLQEDC